ncbi:MULTISPECIES: DoxX family protein [unclassified Streptomyces]|uniref:DoxX family protein n=1 Tax=unclassified Streptomyces TaxID=2593676 RepID=UPI001BE63B37|nr:MULTISPECIES: DoxX family protein [unclassified Streptomyces]MBT2408891.1 DoxX family protein [Streptomyces sp. ISL-21]MBT2612414.1 DoxX family protein [Streptomyces sp. ISL-87]
MDVLVLIGRILFALVFLGSSLNHLTHTKAMAGYAASRGVPSAAAAGAVAGSGLLILVGGVMVALGLWADLGALLLVVFLFPTVVIMHAFWRESDAQARQMEMVHFMKDSGLGGAGLVLLAFFSYAGHDLGLTITGPLFHIT